ncbi:MAG: ABC transporter substrate-binding protein [Syntrophorhabdales bacterium]|jgi:ABC-type branched-subunit amino acid transport system substrate-binding protein
MKQHRHLYSMIPVLVGALVLVSFYGCGQKEKAQSSVRIAANIPLTGPQASFAGEYPVGLKMGIEEEAAARGVDPAVFKLDIQDNQGSPQTALTVFQSQKLRGFDVYISGLSMASLAIAPELDKMDTPHIFSLLTPC